MKSTVNIVKIFHNFIFKDYLTVGINNYNTIINYQLDIIRSRFAINGIYSGYEVCLQSVIGNRRT